MIIKTSDSKSLKSFIKQFNLPKSNSHKGQNGKLLIIGGSNLFHSASIWAAEISSHFVDMVHYSSTKENNEIFLALKKKFRNGMVVAKKDLLHYVNEDDVILLGPGMVRGKITNDKLQMTNFEDVLKIKNEGEYTYFLTKYLLKNFPDKKFVIDAGVLQMMDKNWLLDLKTEAIVTPHQKEFENLFDLSIHNNSSDEKKAIVKKTAKKYNCVILLKAVVDIISDGEIVHVIEGGNAGLTKGGTGDLLAGLTAAFYTKNDAVLSACLASMFLKKSADRLFLKKGYWYNIANIIEEAPKVLKEILFSI